MSDKKHGADLRIPKRSRSPFVEDIVEILPIVFVLGLLALCGLAIYLWEMLAEPALKWLDFPGKAKRVKMEQAFVQIFKMKPTRDSRLIHMQYRDVVYPVLIERANYLEEACKNQAEFLNRIKAGNEAFKNAEKEIERHRRYVAARNLMFRSAVATAVDAGFSVVGLAKDMRYKDVPIPIPDPVGEPQAA